MQPTSHRIPLLLLALTALALFTCLRIELLNAQCNHYLPRRDLSDDGNHKWRQSSITTESSWRRMKSTTDPSITTRPLTPEESSTMAAYLLDAHRGNALRDTVESLGLLQYLLTFLLLLLLPASLFNPQFRPWRPALASALLLNLLCISLMLYRGYFTSLGW